MTRFGSLVITLIVALGFSSPGATQDSTLADIRQEMTVLFVEIQKLKRELSTTGGVNSTGISGQPLERIDLIEGELRRLTARTEELEFRINRVVVDGTNRIGDLEFRLVELEGGDISLLGETTTLGGVDILDETLGGVDGGQVLTPGNGGQLAVSESADFDRAKAALDAQDFAIAAQLFQTFGQTYTHGPLSGPANYYRGEALAGLGRTTDAARAYLESYSGAPDSVVAADALQRLGAILGELGKVGEACVTLGQVEILYPGSGAVEAARAEMANLACA